MVILLCRAEFGLRMPKAMQSGQREHSTGLAGDSAKTMPEETPYGSSTERGDRKQRELAAQGQVDGPRESSWR
jgi:hypothetical protein